MEKTTVVTTVMRKIASSTNVPNISLNAQTESASILTRSVMELLTARTRPMKSGVRNR